MARSFLAAVWLSSGIVMAADAGMILHNGKIVTVDKAFSVREAVAVKDGRITATGRSAEVLRAERGAGTRVLDLEGKTVLPGLIDSHVHALGAGLSEFRRPLESLTSFDEIQQYIRERARNTPEGKWIVVPRTFPTRLAEMRMPTREVLDAVKTHPVMFDASYVVVVNSFALKMCGITRSTPNPPGGVIAKDSNGEPNGILRNGESLLKGLDESEEFTEAEKLQALEAMLGRYAAAGLTSVVDRALTPEQIELYRKLKREKGLPVRVLMTWRLNASGPTDEIVETIRKSKYSREDGDDWLRFGIFKVTLDGGMTIGTAYQREPYGPFGRQLYGQPDPSFRG
ncbi:MAG: amidohydrolase, partial [Bryobacteraceae bacterium]